MKEVVLLVNVVGVNVINMTIKELKQLSKEEFMKQPGAFAELYENLQKSKEGWIEIWKDDKSVVEQGRTYAFGEGISCYMTTMQTWYRTSIIQKINWDEGYFTTLNSKYNFKFKELTNED